MSTLMVEVSDYPFRFRRPIFQKIDGPYHNECGALNKYSEFRKTPGNQQDSVKLFTDKNRCLHHHNDVGC